MTGKTISGGIALDLQKRQDLLLKTIKIMEKQLEKILEEYPNYKEFLWYQAHEKELLRQYYGRNIVIKDGQVIGEYSSKGLARRMTLKQGHEPGSFIIHHCVPAAQQKKFHLANHQLVTIKHG